MENPVGTGPYRLKEWRRGQKIVLEASPTFRDEVYPDSAQPGDRAIVAKMRGKKLPIIGRVEISIIEESNPRLLAFEKGELDYITVPTDLVPKVLNGDKLKPEFATQGHHPRARRAAHRRLHVLQHGGSDRRRVHQRQDRAAPRDQHGVQQRGRDQGDPPRPGDARDAADSAQRRRPRSRLTRAARTTTSPARRRCSTSSATSTRTATAGATCPTASR